MNKDCCAGCGLRRQTCFCGNIPRLNGELKLSLITHPREILRASNTGKLLLAAIPSSRRVIWQRGESAGLGTAEKKVLLYPYKLACEYQLKQSRPAPQLIHQADIQMQFIALDGTWQEAHKMYRQSPMLQQLDILQLPASQSQYRLRRNQQAGNLSTIESVAAIYDALGLADNARALLDCQDQFARYYQASLSNHCL